MSDSRANWSPGPLIRAGALSTGDVGVQWGLYPFSLGLPTAKLWASEKSQLRRAGAQACSGTSHRGSQEVGRCPPEAGGRNSVRARASCGIQSPLVSAPPLRPSSSGGMYHGDLTDKLKVLYKLHLPPGESLPSRSLVRDAYLSRAGAAASKAQASGGPSIVGTPPSHALWQKPAHLVLRAGP